MRKHTKSFWRVNMVYEEFRQLLRLMGGAYPTFHYVIHDNDYVNFVDVWFEILKEYDYEILRKKMILHIEQSPNFPTIYDLLNTKDKGINYDET